MTLIICMAFFGGRDLLLWQRGTASKSASMSQQVLVYLDLSSDYVWVKETSVYQE